MQQNRMQNHYESSKEFCKSKHTCTVTYYEGMLNDMYYDSIKVIRSRAIEEARSHMTWIPREWINFKGESSTAFTTIFYYDETSKGDYKTAINTTNEPNQSHQQHKNVDEVQTKYQIMWKRVLNCNWSRSQQL